MSHGQPFKPLPPQYIMSTVSMLRAKSPRVWTLVGSVAAASMLAVFNPTPARTQAPATQQADQQAAGAALKQYCGGCHSAAVKSGGIVIDPANFGAADQAETWERVIRQVRAQSMPPPNMPRPDKATY